jgi:hypothetical protein
VSQRDHLQGGCVELVVRQERAEDHEAVREVHTQAYEEWMTGTFVYPDVFWALDCVGLRGERLEMAGSALDSGAAGIRDPRTQSWAL